MYQDTDSLAYRWYRWTRNRNWNRVRLIISATIGFVLGVIYAILS